MTRRSIDECVDCRVDKMSIPGGGFIEPNDGFIGASKCQAGRSVVASDQTAR